MIVEETEEVWKSHPIHKDYEGSSFGRVKNKITGRIISIPYLYYKVYVGNYKRQQIHRFIYECFYGVIPKGLLVLHWDENLPDPHLNGPGNLFLGTDEINSKDRKQKDRGNRPTGERNPKSKLTEKEVLEMRELWKKRDPNLGPNNPKQPINYKILSKKFGVSTDIIYNVVNLKTWRHLS